MRSGPPPVMAAVVLVVAVVLMATGAACDTRPAGEPAPFAGATTAGSTGTPASPRPPTPAPLRGTAPAAGGPASVSPGWTLTVYYTAVEDLHAGAATTVRGCAGQDCEGDGEDLGSYPAGFVWAVREEGTGRTADGRYLNWSDNVGFWLDDAPRDSGGRALIPFVTAAADADVLASGAGFTVADCGVVEEGAKPPQAICDRLRAARWRVSDTFTPGLGGAHHVDLYIGEEFGDNFTETDWYITLTGARLAVRGR